MLRKVRRKAKPRSLKISAFWALAFLGPALIVFGATLAAQELLHTLALEYAPFLILIGAFGLWAGKTYRGWATLAPTGRGLLFLALSMALAPGLMANLVLKDHWSRPRPVQVAEFGGAMEFRPWHRTDGACKRNCSFVSGEGSSAFWTLAPAIMAPPPVRPYAVVAALAFGTAVSVLRIAFGGHFLSDTIFAALLTALIVLGLHRVMFSPGRDHEP